jgi:hypothetical protein
MNEPLRPFTLGEILDRTAQLYRRHFLLFAGVAAAPTGVLVAVFAACGVLLGTVSVAARSTMSADAITGLIVIGVLLVGLPVGLGATVVSHAALTHTAVHTHMGRPQTMREAFKSVWPRFWRYLGLLILQVVLAGLIPGAAAAAIVSILAYFGFRAGNGTVTDVGTGVLAILVVMAAFVYIVWRALGYSMAMAVCVVEDKLAMESLSRSVKLSRGTRGRIFVMALLVWAISIVLSFVTYIPMVIVLAVVTAVGHGAAYAAITTVVAEILQALLNFALQMLVTPVYMTALVLFYFDQRIRTEGYDIEYLMEQAGLTGVGTVAALDPVMSPDTVTGL